MLTPLGIAHAGFARTPEELVGTRWGNAGSYHPGWVYHGLMIGSPAAAALLLDRLLRGDLLSSASFPKQGAHASATRIHPFASYAYAALKDWAGEHGRYFGESVLLVRTVIQSCLAPRTAGARASNSSSFTPASDSP